MTGSLVRRRLATGLAALVGTAFLGLGVWAFVSPESFAAVAANFPPYNEHYLHDVGAFQIGLGSGLFAATVVADGLLVGLIAATAAAAVHTVSHVIDRNLGGRTSDPYTVGSLALLLLLALALVARGSSPAASASADREVKP